MFQSFTGTSRRPRQVNLSGRPSNPFATGQHAVAAAQQERAHRQQQRERQQASTRIQKTWRAHASRRRTFKIWRKIWDEDEAEAHGGYPTAYESLQQLTRLMMFYNPRREPSDVSRICWYGTRQITTLESLSPAVGREISYWKLDHPWQVPYSKLRRGCIAALRTLSGTEDGNTKRTLLGILAFFAKEQRFLTYQEVTEYYETLLSSENLPKDQLEVALLAPLSLDDTYALIGLVVLFCKPMPEDVLKLLKSALQPSMLSKAAFNYEDRLALLSARESLWTLGNMIALVGHGGNLEFIMVITRLLGALADEVDFEGQPVDEDNVSFDRDVLSKVTSGFPLNTFLHEQVKSLVDQDSVRSLLFPAEEDEDSAQILAAYALTLLRCFPRRADEIRMWLYRGPANRATKVQSTEYLLTATKSSNAFTEIASSSNGVVALLMDYGSENREDWAIILVFLELLTFVLKIMDDDEFMRSFLLQDMGRLVTFLKNLGFTLYFNYFVDEPEPEPTRPNNKTSTGRFGRTNGRHSEPDSAPNVEERPVLVAGLPGLTIDYLKGVVTGLLRAIYERDSRRHFLPSDHWLMTERFDMTSFIPGVVAEEESRHLVQEQDDEDRDDESDEEESDLDNRRILSAHARSLRNQAARQRALRKASRKRYLESVAPRLEILQNMPFFIPFHTRVQIFHQFVYMDQEKRRNGYVDPDMWRHNMMFQTQNGMPPRDLLARHHAKIKRTQEFKDAFEQFYDLGADLKEPIQITFVDAFDMPEAGIDGGGVTKEFLTSVISQAFSPELIDGNRFFVENDKHLLYPNPTVFEDVKLKARKIGLAEHSEPLRETLRDLTRQYEFLGRIIGKCLYEGILVDVNFAGFFLKKWALTGGTGSAALESGYRASINDLRELDEDLYRGLLQLKKAEDAESFGLTFTVDDLVGDKDHYSEVIEHELAPNGANTAVTNENRLFYINRLAYYRLQGQSMRQTNAFLKGLGAIIQPSWLSMFNQTELQTLIGGAAANIDVQDLRRNTLYGGTYVVGDDGREHPSVQLFWHVMQTMADEDRRKVLKFVTSTPRGPLLGFSHLNPKFSIRDSGSDENRFPTTSTCVNLLKLPMYKSEEVLREKLLAAVNSGAGFDLS